MEIKERGKKMSVAVAAKLDSHAVKARLKEDWRYGKHHGENREIKSCFVIFIHVLHYKSLKSLKEKKKEEKNSTARLVLCHWRH